MPLFSSARFHTFFIFVVVLFSSNAFAHDEVLLTLEDTSGTQITFTREDLAALPQTEFTTSTPWTTKPHHYQGPQLRLLMEKLPQPVQSIRVFAVNGYASEISAAELQKYPYVLTMQQDGKNLTLRNKGPLWILLPFDEQPGLSANQTILNQSVWQVDKIKAL